MAIKICQKLLVDNHIFHSTFSNEFGSNGGVRHLFNLFFISFVTNFTPLPTVNLNLPLIYLTRVYFQIGTRIVKHGHFQLADTFVTPRWCLLKAVLHLRKKNRAQKKEFKILNCLVLSDWSAQGRSRNKFPQPIKLREKSERSAFGASRKRP